MTKSIILLSGGLDSLVALGLCKDKYNIALALTFDYGQKTAPAEIKTSKNICDFYKIDHKIITLDWLKDITHCALVKDIKLPKGIQKNSDSTWVPNRNGLFLNIAGCFADGENYNNIIIGANKEEASIFSDNTFEFIEKINDEFELSTKKHPKVIAPLINLNKNDIVKQALINHLPLEFVMSCYESNEKHCGKCDSCCRLKKALLANNDTKYLGILFE